MSSEIMTKHFQFLYHHRSLFIAAFAAMLFVVFASFFMKGAAAEAPAQAANEHIITLHDDGVDKGFITKAATLRDALKEAGIRVDEKDRTEPSLDERLVASSYEVNIYHARPVIIRDGKTETKIISAYRTGRQIAEEAGLKLHDEDTATLSHSDDILTDGAAEVLTIDYATPLTFVFYGKTLQSYTQATSVGEMLKEKGIKVAENDTLNPGSNTTITAGMTVKLWKNGEQTITQDEDIPFETEQIKDANHDKSYKEVKTPGVNGKKTVTYKIVMQDGVEVSRTVVNSVTQKEPTKQVEVVGTKVNLPAGSHTDWMAAAGVAPSDYGYADFIFSRESGWRPNAVSPNGYYGLGQTNLAKLSSACPSWETDPVCQIRLFSSYASRYGGWEGSYNFWVSHHWW
jgi:uncharacterized protein YabE (DUF348 family)